jgi:hypothetical protein
MQGRIQRTPHRHRHEHEDEHEQPELEVVDAEQL